jgi:eukaryotic-like serine/threonine-protein kinase
METARDMHPQKLGRYEIEGEIGEGAMGRVYRAFDPLARRPVAIKTIKRELLAKESGEEFVRRFRREVQAAGGLSHPGIVTVYDIGDDFFVMELIEGETLQALIKSRGAMGLAEALRILAPVAGALDHAHRKGVIHRDVKPANIMVLRKGGVKIMDFGVARMEATVVTTAGQILGSPSYMAPEQIASGEATPRSDVFALAAVAYEMLTGRRAFDGANITTVIYRVMNEAPVPPRQLNDRLPLHHDDVFAKALAKDPVLRYASATEFVGALEAREIDQELAEIVIPEAEPQLPAAAPEAAQLGARIDLARPAARPAAAPDRWLGWAVAAGAVGVAVLAGLLVVGTPGVRQAPSPAASSASEEERRAPNALLRVETQPPDATVSVDGRELGAAPLDLPVTPGAHLVRADKQGFAPSEKRVEVGSAEGEFVRLDLEPLVAPLNVTAKRRTAPVRSTAAVPEPTPEPKPREGDLVELGPDVTPPRKLSGPPAVYPASAVVRGRELVVAVTMTVTETGEPTDLALVESANELLDRAVLKAVAQWRFEPATKDGVRVRVRWTTRYRFVAR